MGWYGPSTRIEAVVVATEVVVAVVAVMVEA